MTRRTETEVLILGGGPAGIAAALACYERGLRFALFERGADLRLRQRADPADIASGIGGAGLFSDGKFSFYPSATQLWKITPDQDLRAAYQRVAAIMERAQLKAPPFPDTAVPSIHERSPTPFESKSYQSTYMPLDSRYSMVEEIVAPFQRFIRINSSVVNLSTQEGGHVIAEITEHSAGQRGRRYSMHSAAIIVANGRLGPLFLQRILQPNQLSFQRLEVGFRIEQAADQFFLRGADTLDPKRIWRRDDGVCEWRTFCCCRNGEIVSVLADDILSVSGRSDITATGYSNIGFHVRILEPTKAASIWSQFRARTAGVREPIVEPLPTFLYGVEGESRLESLFGPQLTNVLKEGLNRLLQTYQGAQVGASLHAPAIEGVVDYPRLDRELRIPELPVWVAGDAGGTFRGITAALVSGYFSGLRVASYLESIR